MSEGDAFIPPEPNLDYAPLTSTLSIFNVDLDHPQPQFAAEGALNTTEEAPKDSLQPYKPPRKGVVSISHLESSSKSRFRVRIDCSSLNCAPLEVAKLRSLIQVT